MPSEESVPTISPRRLALVVLGATAALHLVLALGMALTRAPWHDEGLLANPAFNLATRGFMGTTVLEPSADPLPTRVVVPLKGLGQYTYMVMPSHLMGLAGWFKLFGFGLFQMRFFTILWGLAALAAWYAVVRMLSGDKALAVLAFVLAALDYGYLLRVSEGRPDAMSAACGLGALAAYLWLRERDLKLAMLAAHGLVAASGLTSPNGGILAFAGVVFLALYWDRRRLGRQHLGMALIPYVVGAALWGWYILQSPSSFLSQFSYNAVITDGRLAQLASPWSNLKLEVTQRYLRYLGGFRGQLADWRQLKLVLLVAYLAGFFGALLTPAIRRSGRHRPLLILAALYFVVLAFTDGRKSQCYLIHVIPLYGAVLAAWLRWCWRQGRVARWALAFAAGGWLAVSLGGAAYQIRQDSYHNDYLPAVRFLQQNTTPKDLIMGSATLGFGLGYPDNLLDDIRLGYRSGKTPRFIVVNDWYAGCFRGLGGLEPEAYRFVSRRLSREYGPVYSHGSFAVYARTGP